MNRIVNYRPALFIALFLCAGILAGGAISGSLLMSVMIPIASVAVGICLYFLTKKHTAWILLLAFAVGISAFLIDNAAVPYAGFDGDATVVARVERVKESSGSVVVSSDEFSGYAVFFDTANELEEGDEIVLSGKFEEMKFSFSDSYAEYYYSQKILYKVKVDSVTKVGTKPSIFQKIRLKCRMLMLRHMEKDDTAIAMSLLFGDKSTLSEKVSDDVAGAGLSHIFAVSGLHVGFIAAALTFILKKLGAGKKLNFSMNLLFLVLYGFLAGFPSGVKRAIIMYVVYAFASLVRRKPDPLSALSVAAVLILIISPREIFDVGFRMSVGAVAGILLFYTPIFRPLAIKLKFPLFRYLYGIVCMTLVSNVFLLPITFSLFGTFSLYSIVGNIAVLPPVTVFFPFLVIAAALSLLYGGFGVLFAVIKYPIICLRLISSAVSSLPYSVLSVSGMNIAALFYILFFICLSRFVLLKGKPKVVICSVFASLTILFLLLPI